MLLDPPFADRVSEWQPSDPDWNTLVFYVLAAVALGLAVWGRKRLTSFDLATLGLTFVGAVLAIRGIPWFALSCMVLLPVAIGHALEGGAAPVRARLNRSLALGALAVLGVAVAAALLRDPAWYERKWPNDALAAVERASSDPRSRVFATDRHADWLLWKIPDLRGRIAYDVRFELYEPSFFDRLVAYHGEDGARTGRASPTATRSSSSTSWARPTRPTFLAEPGARALYRDDKVTVVLRPATQ